MKKSFSYYKKKLDDLNFHESMRRDEPQQQQQEPVEMSGGGGLFDKGELKSNDESRPLDTVGAIAIDTRGQIASAISSGGILLKLPGRVGHASFFGCGCWVDEDEDDDEHEQEEKNSIAICTTGCGEYIIKTLFAKQCVDHILANTSKTNYDLDDFFNKKFFSNFQQILSPKKKKTNLICQLLFN